MEESKDLQLDFEGRGSQKNSLQQNFFEAMSRRSIYINFHPCIWMLSLLMPCLMIFMSFVISSGWIFFFHQVGHNCMTALGQCRMARSNLHVEAVLRSSIQHVQKKLMLKDIKIKKLKKKIDEKNSVIHSLMRAMLSEQLEKVKNKCKKKTT